MAAFLIEYGELTIEEQKFIRIGQMQGSVKNVPQMAAYLRRFRALMRTDEDKKAAGMTDEEIEKEHNLRDEVSKSLANAKL